MFQHLQINAQNHAIDSLKLALKNAKHDTTRCNILSILAETASDEEWPAFNEQLKVLAEKNIANNSEPKKLYLKHLADALNYIGYLAGNQGDIPKALEYYHKSLKIYEEIGDKEGIALSLNNIGGIYSNQGDIPKALEYYHKSLKIREEIGDKLGIATSLNNIGFIYQAQGDISKALEYYRKSLKIYEEIRDKQGIALSLNNIGGTYSNQGDIPKGLEYYHKSLKIQEEIRDKLGIARSLNNIANLNLKKGQVKEALVFAKKGMQTAKELGYPENIKHSAYTLNQIFQKQNKYKEAFEMYELEIKMRDSINNQETQKAAIKKQIQYTYEKQEEVAKAEHKKELEKQQALAEEKNTRQNIIIGSVAMGLLLVLIFAGYVFKTLKATRKQKTLIEHKNKEIEEKQKEILDSIQYARRIQMAQIPSEKRVLVMINKLKKSG
ncbi:MAG: tetratricopeptide repeat protein [Sphingobacteriaceae bacterium]|nr:tetratricopeptide repeat protein [Sphingobacteriaceae bacterium]